MPFFEEPRWLKHAREDLGVTEVSGPEHNPRIIEMGRITGLDWFVKDEIPWCAVAQNAWLIECGLPGTGSAMARSFEEYGFSLGTDTAAIVPGAILVFKRPPNPQSGHVGIATGRLDSRGNPEIIGGNQSNAVTIQTYPADRLLDVRWPSGEPMPREIAVPKPVRRPPLATSTEKTGLGGALTGLGGALQTDLGNNAAEALEAVQHPATRALAEGIPWAGAALMVIGISLILMLVIRKRADEERKPRE